MFSGLFASNNRIGVQKIVISGLATYTDNPNTPILTGIPSTPAPTTSNTFTNAGTYTSSDMTIVPGPGYTLGTVTGSYLVNKAVLTIASSNASMTYRDSLPTFDYIPSGFLKSDTGSLITGTVTHSTTGSSTANAGSYLITPNVSGLSSANYTFSASNGTLTINKAVITITASNASMTYGNSLPTFVSTSSGFLGDDTASVITGSVTHSTTGSSIANVGSYTITPNVSSLSATNYSFSASNGTLTINKAVLTITSSNASMTYRGSLPTFGYSPSGFLGTDTISVITGTVTHSTTGSSTANAGSYLITPNVSGLSSANYTFSASNGTLTINKAVITITASNASMTYGNSLPTFVSTSSGFLGDDTASVITGSVTHSTTGSSIANVGSYTITPNVSSLSATNYSFSASNGTLTINKATLTASTTTGSATYNGSSQEVTVLSGINGTYSGSTTKSGIDAGIYPTTITGTENYTGSVTGTLTISPATITLQGTGESKTYNGTTQSVGYTVGGTAQNNHSYTISGTSAKDAGTYTATITSTTSNYIVSPTINSFTWTIYRAEASSSPASGTTIYQVYDGSTKSASVFSGLSGLSYSGNHVASGVNAGTYPTTITLGGNYSGSITGYLVISQAFGDISLYMGDYIPAGNTNTVLFSRYLQRANASYTWSHSVSGPGAGDAYIQPGYGVESTSLATAGFVVTITATISDPNYTASSATTSITFEAYVPPPSGGGGYGGGGGFIAE